ncbi:hypothetical protein scyTo_0017122 [Scyliorhinus torazame]|uniref:EF-hand domain-containing protein n=1 Tax=Scyliorhinus torazame TaxID=75743 RepID=A0A401Q4G7_SCYTO|nr:hypothetical protein [Scyliorhinus torazame]
MSNHLLEHHSTPQYTSGEPCCYKLCRRRAVPSQSTIIVIDSNCLSDSRTLPRCHPSWKGELRELLQSELGNFLAAQKDPSLVDNIMRDLDSNKDNEVDFNEFVILVAALTVACNDFFEDQLRKKGKA